MIYRQHPDFIFRRVRDEMLGVNLRSGVVSHLNNDASMIFEALAESRKIAEAVSVLQRHFEGQPEEIQAALSEFSTELVSDGVLIDAQLASGLEPFTIRSGDWKQELEEIGAELLVPVHATIELLGRCHLDCVHCYIPKQVRHFDADNDKNGAEQRRGLSEEQIISTVDRLAELGCLLLTVTGGEIFLRRDVRTILGHASATGFALELLTSGSTLSEADCDFLSSQRIAKVQISIYGADARVHDGVTQRVGSFARSIQTAKWLIERRIYVELATTVMQSNIDSLERVADLATAIGAGVTLGYPVTSRYDGSQDTHSLRPTPSQIERVVKQDVANLSPYAIDDRPICTAGRGRLAVNALGDVSPCNQWPMPVGNIHSTELKDIWANSPLMKELRSKSRRDLNGDRFGDDIPEVVVCPGLNYVEEGDYLKLANVAHEVAVAYQKAVATSS